MSSNHTPNLDEQLHQHIDALRDEPIPDGPSANVLTKTQAILGLAMEAPTDRIVIGRRSFAERIVAMTLFKRIAAILFITLGAVALYVAWQTFNTTTVAFADVAQKLNNARTLVYTSTVTLPGKPPVTMRNLHASGGRTRIESPGGPVSITDGRSSLLLDPNLKTATRLDFGKALPTTDFASAFGHLAKTGGDPIGQKTFDGVVARGFRADAGGIPMTIWADPKTALPVQVETITPMAQGNAVTVLDHFQFDAPLDEALFSMEVPQGYTLITQKIDMPESFAPESVVADFLRTYTQASGGSFPARLDNPDELGKLIARETDSQKRLAATTRMGMMLGALFALRDRWGYAAEGVKVGEKDKVVFWCKLNPNSNSYQAVFGDLHIEQVFADRIPATQPLTPSQAR
jgi:outer membrane lipoprotein-sorting protein